MRSSRERGPLSPSSETLWHSCKLGGKAAQMSSWGSIGLLFAGAMAGLINTLAGGGPVLTLMALTLFGRDPRRANLTSTVALVPGQLLTSNSVWRRDAGTIRLTGLLVATAVIGGAAGAWLLIATPPQQLGRIVPRLVLFATAAYAFGPQQPADGSAAQTAVRLPRAPSLPIGQVGSGFLKVAAALQCSEAPPPLPDRDPCLCARGAARVWHGPQKSGR